MIERQMEPKPVVREDDGLKEFLLVLRRACLLIVDFVERRYDLPHRRA